MKMLKLMLFSLSLFFFQKSLSEDITLKLGPNYIQNYEIYLTGTVPHETEWKVSCVPADIIDVNNEWIDLHSPKKRKWNQKFTFTPRKLGMGQCTFKKIHPWEQNPTPIDTNGQKPPEYTIKIEE